MTETYEEKVAYWERLAEVKKELSDSLSREPGVKTFPWVEDKDILVTGPLSVIIEWAQDWRSEIEELG